MNSCEKQKKISPVICLIYFSELIGKYSEGGTRSVQKILNTLRRECGNKSTSVSSTFASQLVLDRKYKRPSADDLVAINRNSIQVLVLYDTINRPRWRDELGYVGTIIGSMFQINKEQVRGKLLIAQILNKINEDKFYRSSTRINPVSFILLSLGKMCGYHNTRA